MPVLLILGILCVLGTLGFAFYAARTQLNRYPDGPGWVREMLDKRMVRAVSTQSLLSEDLTLRVNPATGMLQARANLEIETGSPKEDSVSFLLNPGLKVLSARCKGDELSVWRRGALVCISLPSDVSAEQRTSIELAYEGTPVTTSLAEASLSEDQVWLPWTTCWHPLDCSSFIRFACSVRIDSALSVAGWTREEGSEESGGHTFRLATSQPVMGIPLVAGRGYAEYSGLYGDIAYTINFPIGGDAAAVSYGETIVAAEGALRAFLGGGNPPTIQVIVSERIRHPQSLGNGLLALPLESNQESDALFVGVVEELARRWWGGTVSPSWFPARADGGGWLLHGLAKYSAWKSLEEARGKSRAIEFIEQQHPRPATRPLRSVGALNIVRGSQEAAEASAVNFARIARWFESCAGSDAFWDASRTLLQVHAGNAITIEAFQHALELACEQDLNEAFRVLLDRPGSFDYEVSDVHTVAGKVEVDISSRGNIPALHPVTLCIITARGVDLHRIEPGASGGTFVFDVDSAVKRVSLDPYFESPDLDRANNTWPRRNWPVSVAVHSSGDVAVAIMETWESDGAQAIRLTAPKDESVEHIRLPAPLSGPLLWSDAEGLLAFAAGRVYVRPEGGNIFEVSGTARPIDWIGNSLLLNMAGDDDMKWGLAKPPFTSLAEMQLPCAPLVNGFASYNRGEMAFISQEDRSIWARTSAREEWECVEGEETALSAPVFVAPERIRFFLANGTLLEASRETGIWEKDIIITLGHPIARAFISKDGLLAAWEREDGRLLYSRSTPFAPRTVNIEGKCVDFALQSSEAVLCLTRTNEWALPGRFHATYQLERIDCATGDSELLARFPAH